MKLTLNKSFYDSLSPWKKEAVRHAMGGFVLGTPSVIHDTDGSELVSFGDDRFTPERALMMRLVLAGLDALPDEAPEDATAPWLLADGGDPVTSKGAFVPDWKAGETYAVEQTVFYGGRLWECLTGHTASTPPGPSSAEWFSTLPEGHVEAWQTPSSPADAYMTGDRVLFEEQVYEAQMDNLIWSPSAYPAGWSLIE